MTKSALTGCISRLRRDPVTPDFTHRSVRLMQVIRTDAPALTPALSPRRGRTMRRDEVNSGHDYSAASGVVSLLTVCAKTSAGEEACFKQNDPHPDPLPSDGRGNRQPRLSQLPKRLNAPTDGGRFSLSHPIGEGWGEGPRKSEVVFARVLSGLISRRGFPWRRGEGAPSAPRSGFPCFWVFGIRASFVIRHLSFGFVPT
jgi:hypothetical protein